MAGDSESAIAQAAKEGKLAAVIVGEVRDGGKRFKLRVYGAGGDLIGEGSWAEAGGVKKLDAAVERTLWARVGGSLSKARAGAADKGDATTEARTDRRAAHKDEGEDRAERRSEPERRRRTRARRRSPPTSAEESPPPRKRQKKRATVEVEAEAADESPRAAGTALDLAVGPRFVSRNLVVEPAGSRALRRYSLGPRARRWGRSSPGTRRRTSRGGWASNLGLATSIEYTPGLVSQTSDGLRYPTTESDYWGGVRGRLLFGAVQALAHAGRRPAHVHLPQRRSRAALLASLTLPDVKYTYARVGVDLRIALPANLALMLGGGYRYVFIAGDHNYLIQASQYFPSSKFLAFDVTASVGYRFLPVARGARRVRPAPLSDDGRGATPTWSTGATDQYVSYWVQIAVLIDGFAAGEGGPAVSPRRPARAPAPTRTNRPRRPKRRRNPGSAGTTTNNGGRRFKKIRRPDEPQSAAGGKPASFREKRPNADWRRERSDGRCRWRLRDRGLHGRIVAAAPWPWSMDIDGDDDDSRERFLDLLETLRDEKGRDNRAAI